MPIIKGEAAIRAAAEREASRPRLEYYKLHSGASEPFRAYGDSVGYDLSAYLLTETGRPNSTLLPPSQTKAIATGLALRAPPGHFIMVCSRSGLAQQSLFVANAPGIIDPSYTGEVKVLLYNGGFQTHRVQHGDRIGQVVILPFAALSLLEVKEPFTSDARGDKGFGSSGR